VPEPQPHGIRFSFAALLKGLDSKAPFVELGNPLNLFPGSVGRMPFHEDDFYGTPKGGESPQRILDIPFLVARGNDARKAGAGPRLHGTKGDDICQAEPAD
jgi:hypothetical protein